MILDLFLKQPAICPKRETNKSNVSLFLCAAELLKGIFNPRRRKHFCVFAFLVLSTTFKCQSHANLTRLNDAKLLRRQNG